MEKLNNDELRYSNSSLIAYYSCYSAKEDGTGEKYNMHERYEKCVQDFRWKY
jgi:hypothetical protein